jgi:hypothetical protein
MEDVLRSGVRSVLVNGNGETTLVKAWPVHYDELMDGGMSPESTKNLAKLLSEQEVALFSGFHRIVISCDTSHHALFRRLRRTAGFAKGLEDMARISRSL